LSCASNAWYCWLKLTNCRFVMIRSSVLLAQVACFLRAVFFVLQGKWCSSFSEAKWRQSLSYVEIISISPEILGTKRWAECEKVSFFQGLQLVQQSLPSNRRFVFWIIMDRGCLIGRLSRMMKTWFRQKGVSSFWDKYPTTGGYLSSVPVYAWQEDICDRNMERAHDSWIGIDATSEEWSITKGAASLFTGMTV
jgi:hypothetical protein